jgi:hypothetical protein
MTPRNKIIFFSLLGFCIGLLFLAFQNNIIIIRNPFARHLLQEQPGVEKKKVKLFYWHHDKWNNEEVDIIWAANKAQTLKYLIDSWLTLMDEEHLMEKKTSLQAVVLGSSENDIFLSFDRNPLSREGTIFEKWMWLEGLLKTIRDNDLKVQSIRFLVHHQDMYDTHLDFSNPWPSIGFLPNYSKGS